MSLSSESELQIVPSSLSPPLLHPRWVSSFASLCSLSSAGLFSVILNVAFIVLWTCMYVIELVRRIVLLTDLTWPRPVSVYSLYLKFYCSTCCFFVITLASLPICLFENHWSLLNLHYLIFGVNFIVSSSSYSYQVIVIAILTTMIKTYLAQIPPHSVARWFSLDCSHNLPDCLSAFQTDQFSV